MLFNATRFSYQGSPGWSFVSFSCNEGTIIRIRIIIHSTRGSSCWWRCCSWWWWGRRRWCCSFAVAADDDAPPPAVGAASECCRLVRMVRSLRQQLEDHQLILLSRLGRVPAISRFSEGSWIDFIGNSHPGGWIPCCAARPVVIMRIQASGTNAANVVASSIPIQH